MKSQRTFNPNAGVFGIKAGSELSGTVKSPSSGSELSGTVKSAKPKKKKRRVKANSELSGSVK